MNDNLCPMLTLVISLLLMVYGFILIFKAKPKSNTDTSVISEQLKGFSFLIVAQLVFIFGMSICSNSDLFGLGENLIKGL